ncbi:MAG: PQQ-dependent sugar dehydrogenase [Myxococcota bacterium]
MCYASFLWACSDSLPQRSGDGDPFVGDPSPGDAMGDAFGGDLQSGDLDAGDLDGGDLDIGDSGPGDSGGGDEHAGGDVGGDASGMSSRPANTSCVALPRPNAVGALTTENAFVGTLNLDSLNDLRRLPVSVPGWIGITQVGQVRIAPDGATASQTVLNASNLNGLVTGGEQGLLGLAVDPLYPSASAPNTIRIYVDYTGLCPAGICSYVSRFDLTVAGAGANATFSAGAEEVLMRVMQPQPQHNAGGLNFGLDGFLYISFGDGGYGNDPWCNAQNLTTPLGKLLRIDVHTSPTGYTIPPNNPFHARPTEPFDAFSQCNDYLAQGNPVPGYPELEHLDVSRADPCPEILALGMRNPFRFSVDRDTGWLWIGDVGEDAIEEVTRLDPSIASTGFGTPYFNLGWPLFEGTRTNTEARAGLCAQARTRWSVPQSYVTPHYEYRHNDNPNRGVVVGGFVYRGAALGPAYFGRYFFLEAQTAEFWAMPDPYGVVSTVDVNGLEQPNAVFGIGFAEDDAGELYALTYPTKRIVLAGAPTTAFPERLSETGCVEPTDPSMPASGLIPYAVQSPLWSDAATKERYLALPDGETLLTAGHCGSLSPAECAAQGNWQLPIGSVLLKTFRRNDVLLETRLLMRHDDGDWAGYTYVWNAAQTEAFLAQDAVTIAGQGWTTPSREECLRCHTVAAGRTLGLETAQLNGVFDYPSGIAANQLTTLDSIGMFTSSPGAASTLPSLPDPLAGSADLEMRARAYLHANCANCHRPGGLTGSAMDLRWMVPLPETGTCDVSPNSGSWPASMRLLTPGDPDNSLILLRTRATDTTRMPPLGTKDVDIAATAMLEAWINATTCF